jgi:DNA-binding PadR family transcriptional regulator
MFDHWKNCRRARDEMGWGGRGFGGHRGMGFGGGGRGMHGLRGGRMFDHGDLRLVVLSLLAEKPAHGYELIKAIEEKLGGAYSPSPGVIYPTLTLLEELGYAAQVPGEGAKKLYEVTPEGRAFLEENAAQVEALTARMSEAKGRGAPLPVMRAMENLRTALKLKLTSGTLSEDQARAVAEAIDAAALAVERA